MHGELFFPAKKPGRSRNGEPIIIIEWGTKVSAKAEAFFFSEKSSARGQAHSRKLG